MINLGGQWVETAIRLAAAFMLGGETSILHSLQYVKTGTGLPSAGNDLMLFVKGLSKKTGVPEEEVASAVEIVNRSNGDVSEVNMKVGSPAEVDNSLIKAIAAIAVGLVI